ncbi:hypothetical protein AB0J82_39485 [Asanoa sp. NPDC049518]|uniref:hypothetical protein n=1 Tax=unclassified Asanoa TaxID=2685164 RepID=UPI0034463984
MAAATLPCLAGVLVAAALIGVGTGLITSLGFAALAANTPQERLGKTMGGPLLVGGIAAVAGLTYGFAALAVLLAAER